MLLRFPDGLPGFALLLLRLSATLVAYPVLYSVFGTRFYWWAVAFVAVVFFAAFLAGVGTRAATALLMLVLPAGIYAAPSETQLLLLAAAANLGALLVLGPGAYSIDAQRFGRRVIRVGVRPPDRGTPQ